MYVAVLNVFNRKPVSRIQSVSTKLLCDDVKQVWLAQLWWIGNDQAFVSESNKMLAQCELSGAVHINLGSKGLRFCVAVEDHTSETVFDFAWLIQSMLLIRESIDLNCSLFLFQCSVNGIQYEKLAMEGKAISSVEVFFSGFPRVIPQLDDSFPHLVTLCIIGQDLSLIENIASLTLLEELWLAECKITVSNTF